MVTITAVPIANPLSNIYLCEYSPILSLSINGETSSRSSSSSSSSKREVDNEDVDEETGI